VAGLLPEIKSKIVGCEGDLNQLRAKARFEEAKLGDLGPSQLPPVPPQCPVTQGHVLAKNLFLYHVWNSVETDPV